jgi:hypothetical protein
MKYTHILKIVIIVAFFLIPYFVYSQTSGWVDRGIYNEQILKKDKLKKLHFNDDGSIFYTLHSNKIVYYWSTETGMLLDSLIIPDSTAIPNFSEDGKSLCYYTPVPFIWDISIQNSNTIISIYDLITKTIISKVTLYIFLDYNYNIHIPTQKEADFFDYQLSIIDYDFSKKLLTCGTSFKFLVYSGYNLDKIERTYLCGAVNVFEVRGNVLIKQMELTHNNTFGTTKIFNSNFNTTFEESIVEYYNTDWQSLKIDRRFTLSKFTDSIQNSIIVKNGTYSYEESTDRWSGFKSFSKGINKPFSKLIPDEQNNKLYLKAFDLYYIIDSFTDTVLDSITLFSGTGLEIITKNYQDFIYYYKNNILIQNINSKELKDGKICPIEPVSLELSPNGRDLIVADKNGYIFFYRDIVSFLNVEKNDDLPIIKPNPTNGILFINREPDYLPQNFQIFSLVGLKVFESNYSPTIDVSTLSPGIYIFKYANKSNLFVKY